MKSVKLTKKSSLVVLAVLVVALAGGLAYAYNTGILQFDDKTNEPVNKQSPEEKVEELNRSGDPDELSQAKDTLKKLADDENDKKTKLTYLKGAVDAAGAAGDYTAAVELSKQADAIEKTDLSAANYAGYAELAGDYKLAAEQWGVAAERATDAQAKKDYTASKENVENGGYK